MPIESFENVNMFALIGKFETDPKSKFFNGRKTSVSAQVRTSKSSIEVSEALVKINQKNKKKSISQVNKFVVTEEHRKNPRKLVEDMKASSEKHPKSLCGLNLSKIDFSGLEKLELKELDLSEVDFSSCKFPDETDFEGSKLKNAKFISAKLVRAVFCHNDLSGANFEEANLEDSYFGNVAAPNAVFSKSNMTRVHITQSDFEKAKFERTIFDCAEIGLTSLRDAGIKYAEFTGAHLFNVDMEGTIGGFFYDSNFEVEYVDDEDWG